MAGWVNGHKRFLAGAAGIAAVCSVLSFVGGTYAGWTQRVEASVTDRRMLNAHDETLKAIVPKVETCHETNNRQGWDIDRNTKDIAAMSASVQRMADKIDLLVQSQMREGRIPR